MRKKILALAALPLALAFLGGCGSSGHSTPPPSNNVPVVVSISDTTPNTGEMLPAGVNLISSQPDVTGVCLLTSSDSATAACPVGQSITPSSGNIQFSGISTPANPELLSSGNVTANTYTGVALTFGSTVPMTVSVDAGQNYTDGTNNCDNTAGATTIVCSFNTPVSTTSVTYTFPAPITLTAGTPVVLQVGLDQTTSLTASGAAPGSLSFTPTVTVTQGSVGADGNLLDVNNVTGTVQSISGTTLTLIDSANNQPLTLNIGSGTTVTNYNNTTATCATPNTISCPQAGDVITVGYSASNTNPTSFTVNTINGNPGITSTGGFQGTIVATTPTPQVVVTAVPAGNGLTGIAVGQLYNLDFAAGAAFTNAGGITFTTGSFASPADLVVGQNVLVDVACPAGVCEFTAPVSNTPLQATPGTVTADAIELLPSTISGTLDAGATNPNYGVAGLSSFYTNNGVTGLNGTTNASTTYSGDLTQFSDMTAGEPYYYNGYLLNSGTATTPDVYTTSVYGGPASEPAAVKAKTR